MNNVDNYAHELANKVDPPSTQTYNIERVSHKRKQSISGLPGAMFPKAKLVSKNSNKENVDPNKQVARSNGLPLNVSAKPCPPKHVDVPTTQMYNVDRITNIMKPSESGLSGDDLSNLKSVPKDRSKGNLYPNKSVDALNRLSVNVSPKTSQHERFVINLDDPEFSGYKLGTNPGDVGHNDCPRSLKKRRTQTADLVVLSPDCTPEVQITGERSFADRCNQLSNEGDVLYNSFGNSTSNNFQSASSSAHKKNLYAPRRHVAPSHFKLSPFEDDRLKSHTRPHQVKYHSTIVCLSEDATVQYNKAIDYVRVYVTIWSLGNSFKFGGRVDFYTMNGFCRKLSLDTPATKCKNNFFFSTMADYILCKWDNEKQMLECQKTMKKSFDSARKFITKCDLVFMPCLHRVHWFFFAVDFPGECFIVLDSYFREGSDYHNSIKNRLMQNFSKVWNEETDKQVDFSTFRFEHPIVPMQNNT